MRNTRQAVPVIADADVERIVRRDFPAERFGEVMVLLFRHGQEPREKEPARVRMAILKLANGRFDHLQPHIDMAKRDFRDVVAWAEYPGYMQMIDPAETEPEKGTERVIDEDRRQYTAWLERT